MADEGLALDLHELVIRELDHGCVFAVRATPGSKRNKVLGVREAALCVSVKQAAEKGKANRAVLEFLAECIDLRKSQVELIAGATSRKKSILIKGISSQELLYRLSSLSD